MQGMPGPTWHRSSTEIDSPKKGCKQICSLELLPIPLQRPKGTTQAPKGRAETQQLRLRRAGVGAPRGPTGLGWLRDISGVDHPHQPKDPLHCVRLRCTRG